MHVHRHHAHSHTNTHTRIPLRQMIILNPKNNSSCRFYFSVFYKRENEVWHVQRLAKANPLTSARVEVQALSTSPRARAPGTACHWPSISSLHPSLDGAETIRQSPVQPQPGHALGPFKHFIIVCISMRDWPWVLYWLGIRNTLQQVGKFADPMNKENDYACL